MECACLDVVVADLEALVEVSQACQTLCAAWHMACSPHGLLAVGREGLMEQQHDVPRLGRQGQVGMASPAAETAPLGLKLRSPKTDTL